MSLDEQDFHLGEGDILRYWPACWLTPDADQLLAQLHEQVEWQRRQIWLFGRAVWQPRLVSWYGPAAYRYSGQTLTPKPLPPLLRRLLQQAEQVTGARFNCVLANLYRDQHDSMGWHSDNEPELGNNPAIASVSFGVERVFELQQRATREKLQLPLGNGSILLMAGNLQSHWRHRLPKAKQPCGPRINLTFRLIEPRQG